MNKIVTLVLIILICSNGFGQGYKKIKTRTKHSEKIISIATSNDFFATSSYDKSVIVWDYEGNVIYKYKLKDGKINSLSFFLESNSLLIGETDKNEGKITRHVVKCLDISGILKYEMIDTTFTQEFVDDYYEQNTSGEQNAISNVRIRYPDLSIKKELGRPQVRNRLSHFEIVQDIEVSPNNKTIVSIDKFNILKIWDKNGKILNSLQITNNKKDTEVYFISDSTILVTPNIILNIHDKNHNIIEGFEKYTSIPFDKMIYFHFDYNNESRPEKLYNLETTNVKNLDFKLFYTLNASRSRNSLALLGVDRLIRVINENGEIISTFGKDRNEITTFRGEKIKLFSNICQIGFSPNGEYLISGNENGKIAIWKYE